MRYKNTILSLLTYSLWQAFVAGNECGELERRDSDGRCSLCPEYSRA